MRCDPDYVHLRAAARLALRGHGRAEPNPLVGCVIVSTGGKVVGWGYHEQCGGPHAEIHAIRRAGEAARGATAYITLAPCNHVGRTGPCSQALIEAGVARVVVARDDPNPVAGGGLDALRAAGIRVEVTDMCPQATAVSDPFVHRVQTGLPWVIVKWAQSLDGRIATCTGESKWISGEVSRRLVHRERGRVDAILTGIGTVLADNPLLTARSTRPGRITRRFARRIVIDPQLRIPMTSTLVATADQYPTTIACSASAAAQNGSRCSALEDAGIDIVQIDDAQGETSLAEPALRELVTRYDVTNVLVEAGPGLMSRLFREGLANEALVFVAGVMLGETALPVMKGADVRRLADAVPMRLLDARIRGADVMLRYRIKPETR